MARSVRVAKAGVRETEAEQDKDAIRAGASSPKLVGPNSLFRSNMQLFTIYS